MVSFQINQVDLKLNYLRMAMAMNSSGTTMHLSTRGAAVARELMPTLGTAKPSASVDLAAVYTGWPAFNAALKLAHRSDSTPITARKNNWMHDKPNQRHSSKTTQTSKFHLMEPIAALWCLLIIDMFTNPFKFKHIEFHIDDARWWKCKQSGSI